MAAYECLVVIMLMSFYIGCSITEWCIFDDQRIREAVMPVEGLGQLCIVLLEI